MGMLFTSLTRWVPTITHEMVSHIFNYHCSLGYRGVCLFFYVLSTSEIIPDGSSVVPCAVVMITYFTCLRKSNVLSPSHTIWGGHHTLRRGDDREVAGAL